MTPTKAGRLSRKKNAQHSARPETKPGLQTRQAAARLLAAIVDRQTSMDGLLDPDNGNRAFRELSPADQKLAKAIILVALRHFRLIESLLDRMVDRPLPDGARALSHVLHVAAAQILFLNTPDHAVVDIAVEQAQRDPRNRRFASLVNAVLRRLIRERETLLADLRSSVDNAPPWLADMLKNAYGDDADRILKVLSVEPAIDITVKSDPARWASELGGLVLPTGSVRIEKLEGAIETMPGFAEGQWWVQDAAASIPARLMQIDQSSRVADLCAAPGGKTAQLAMTGAHVTAIDLSANRLKRLSANMERLGLSVTTRQANVLNLDVDEPFDAVLLDAPCSSTGTIRRHPDIPWTKGPEDIEKLAALQEKLLLKAIELVRPGGQIVFSNCSLDPVEGEDMILKVLAAQKDVIRSPVNPKDWPGLEVAINANGEVRTTPAMLPHDNPRLAGLDGFFACVLKRID